MTTLEKFYISRLWTVRASIYARCIIRAFLCIIDDLERFNVQYWSKVLLNMHTLIVWVGNFTLIILQITHK